ncbi:MAG TPA: YhcH/YjgK/YiaL family protein [Patescibacteria group bacterium]|nr:YhcH/YjgK/YiaL family protein [Patescibacteria group bacterium]
MIVGYLGNYEQERRLFPDAICQGLEFLKNTDFSVREKGKHVIDGDDMFVMIDRYQSQPREQRRSEAHKLYLDIQYIISGEEIIAYEGLGTDSVVTEDMTPIQDNVFYRPSIHETDVVMRKGMYAVFFPWDIHRPCCMYRNPGFVEKAVVKVRMALV